MFQQKDSPTLCIFLKFISLAAPYEYLLHSDSHIKYRDSYPFCMEAYFIFLMISGVGNAAHSQAPSKDLMLEVGDKMVAVSIFHFHQMSL